MNNEIELSWAGGFIDGEGCITILTDRKSHAAAINVGQVSRIPLDKLQRLFGGSVGFVHDKRGGHYQWRVYGPSASKTAELLLPYLCLKNEQAELLIAFQKTKGIQGQIVSAETKLLRQVLYLRVKELNKNRILDVERLNEEAPLAKEDDAIVRSYANIQA